MTRTSKKDATKGDGAQPGVIERRAQASSDAHKPKLGRPYTYDRSVVVPAICEQLSKGTPLAEICRGEGMPTDAAVMLWVQEDEGIAFQIAQARARGYDAIAQDCLAIADTPSPVNQFGSTDTGDVAHRKLRIETRLKLLAKWDPKRYGDKQQVEHSGGLTLESLVAGNDAGE